MSADSGALAGWFKRKMTPDAEADAATESAAGETAHDDDQEPVVVWEAANRMEAAVVAGRLQSEGIPAIIRGEALGAIYGLTYGSLAATAVLVPKLLADKALELLAAEVEWDTESENEAGETTDDADRS